MTTKGRMLLLTREVSRQVGLLRVIRAGFGFSDLRLLGRWRGSSSARNIYERKLASPRARCDQSGHAMIS